MSSARNRPAGVTAVGIIALVLGLLGCVGGGFGLIGSIAQVWMFGQMGDAVGTGTEFDALMELQSVSAPLAMGLGVLNGIVSILLIAGAAMVLSNKRIAPNVYLGAAIVSIFYAISAVLVGGYIQFRTHAITQEMMAPMGSAPPEVEMMTSGMAYVGVCFAAVWAIAKICFYGWSAMYLRKPELKDVFTA